MLAVAMRCAGFAGPYGPCGALDCRSCYPLGGDCEVCGEVALDGLAYCSGDYAERSGDAEVERYLDAVEWDRMENV